MPTNVKLSVRDKDVLFDWGKLKEIETGDCYLLALTDFHIALLLSVLRYAEWPTRWTNINGPFSQVTEEVARLENCLMSGCNVTELVTVLQDGFDQLHTDMTDLAGKLDTVAQNQGSGEDLEDDLANLWRQVEQVTLILGGTVAGAPTPL